MVNQAKKLSYVIDDIESDCIGQKEYINRIALKPEGHNKKKYEQNQRREDKDRP